MIKFKERLKELRLANKMSKKELAQALELSEKTISHYENGFSEPVGKTIIKLSKYFKISVDYLLGLKE